MIGPFLRVQPPRTAEALVRVRREVAAWARTTGVGDDMIDDLSLVLSELVSNAIRHGSGPRLRVVVARIGDTIDLRVDDDGPSGTPEPTPPTGEHGRGLAIVRALARSLVVEHRSDGTTARARLPIRPDTASPADTATLRGVPGP